MVEKKAPIFLGVDPGVTGAFAAVSGSRVTWCKYPGSAQELASLLRPIVPRIRLAAVEHVAASPQMGRGSIFTFGRNYGEWLGVLATLDIPYVLITPAKWQKAVLDSSKKGTTKERVVQYVQRRFPDLELKHTQHHAADAVCLALFARNSDD